MTQSRRTSISGGVSSPGETSKPFSFEHPFILTLLLGMMYAGVAIGCTPREYLLDIFNSILDFVLVFGVTLRVVAKVGAVIFLCGHCVECAVATKVALEKDPENVLRWVTSAFYYGYFTLKHLLEMKPRKKAY